jgi:tetratricopeptide (TPR) repeat protein
MVRDRNKIERNLKLLRLALEENPADVNLVMNLGLELVRSDDLAGGVEKYREAFQMMSAQLAGELVPELREVLLTQFTSQLYKIRAHAEVVEVLLSPLARQGGLTASLHLALGLAQFELKQFSEAADQMRQCLAKRKQPALSPINTDIHTAAPQHCLALSRAKLGDLAGAEKTFQLALAEPGGGENLRLDFAKFLAAQNRFVEALGKLHEIVAPNPRQAAAWRLGGEITLGRPELLEFAREWTGEAVRALPDDSVLAGQHADALLLNGDTPAALELWEKIWDRDRSARTLAALILCEAVEAPTTHAPDDGVDELAASRAFIEWYQKLIAVRASALTVRINEQLDKLSRALPTAARMLESALQEAETPAEARAESGI